MDDLVAHLAWIGRRKQGGIMWTGSVSDNWLSVDRDIGLSVS
jgi:hypothetical protein